MADEVKVTFDEAQQQKVNALIADAQGRAAADVRAQLAASEAAKAQAETDLAAAKAALAAAPKPASAADQTEITRLISQIDEIKAANAAAQAENVRVLAQARAEKERADLASQKASNIQKTSAIQAVASKLGFIKPDMVSALTAQSVSLEADGKIVIKKEDGTPRLNASLEPMSLEEYYTEYATQNPFMVRGEVRPGTGAFESQSTSRPGEYKLENLFGKSSNSKLANDLAMSNKKLYHELRAKAVAQGLVVA